LTYISVRAFGLASDLRGSLVGRRHAENFENLRSSTCISLFGCRRQGDENEEKKERGRKSERQEGKEKREDCLRTSIGVIKQIGESFCVWRRIISKSCRFM